MLVDSFVTIPQILFSKVDTDIDLEILYERTLNQPDIIT